RKHHSKHKRPFASGLLSIPFGLKVSAALIALSVATAAFLPPLFAAALAGYLVTTTAYSLSVKRMLLVDVLTLAGLYTIGLLLGAGAGALYRQRCGQGTLRQPMVDVAGGADHPLPYDARLDPGAA